MIQSKKGISISNRVGAAVLAAPIIGHDAMFTLLSVYSFGAFFQLQQYTTTSNFLSPTMS
jgi:hypothetical protein